MVDQKKKIVFFAYVRVYIDTKLSIKRVIFHFSPVVLLLIKLHVHQIK